MQTENKNNFTQIKHEVKINSYGPSENEKTQSQSCSFRQAGDEFDFRARRLRARARGQLIAAG